MVQTSLMLSASLLLCGAFYKQAIHIYKYIKGWLFHPRPVSKATNWDPCAEVRGWLSLERQVLNTAGQRASHPSHPGEPAGFSAPGRLVYFYKRCLYWKCLLSCNFGSSIRLCVCLLLSGGGKRLWLLTTSTDWGWAAHAASPLTDTVTTRAICITSDVFVTQLLFAGYWNEEELEVGSALYDTWSHCLQIILFSPGYAPLIITVYVTKEIIKSKKVQM